MQYTAKTVEEAISEGLKEQNITTEQAEITVIEQPVKGLFGRLKGKAVVEIVKKEILEEQEEKVAPFVENILKMMDLDATIQVEEKEKNTVITLTSKDSSNVIGYRGEILDALQTLAGAFVNIGKKEYKKVVVDCENYRDKREETLISLAKKLEAKATDMKREVILEPMSPYERRIIHTALANSQTVTTRSDGKEPNRYVVIVPNEKDEFAKPYNAGKNRAEKGGQRNNKRFDKRGGRDSFKKGGRSPARPSGEKKKSTITFGTYLGNSLKNDK